MKGKELPPQVKERMLRQGAVIMFGPTYLHTTLEMQHHFEGKLVLSCERIDDLNIPDTLMLSCFMVFCHYLPNCKGRDVTENDFAPWERELLGDITFGSATPLDNVPEEDAFQEPREIGFDRGVTANEILLFVSWGPVESSHWVEKARSLERSYVKHGGYYMPGSKVEE